MNISDVDRIKDYLIGKNCVYESRPFGEYPICYKVAGKIYAQLSPQEEWFKATLKTNPDDAQFLRSAYPGVIVRGYHCPPVQKPYWNTVELAEIEYDFFCQMADAAYQEVVKGLSKKEQKKLLERSNIEYIKVEGDNPGFVKLCEKLDDYLDETVAGAFDRTKYEPFNDRKDMHDVMLAVSDGEPVGCAAYRFYDDETIEMKRVFVMPEKRGLGVGREILLRLEAEAKIRGYKYSILETGELLAESVKMYKRNGYKVIPNYGQYAGMEESLCMQKKL